MSDTTTFRFDGGATWLNLLATQGQSFGPRPIERLSSPAAAADWLTQVGYPPQHPVTERQVDRLRALREALRDLAMATVAEGTPSTEAIDLIHAAAHDPAVLVLRFEAVPQAVPFDTALGAIAMQALVTVGGPDRRYLAECAEVDCRWVFLDTSGRRHWCPSPSCASRGRVRAHRERKAIPSLPVSDPRPGLRL